MAKYDYLKIKNEMQGPKGLIKEVRDRHLPDTIKMSRLAQSAFEERNLSTDSIDFALSMLLKFEYEFYLIKQHEITARFIEYADEIANSISHPTIRQILDDYYQEIAQSNSPTKILEGIVHISTSLADSNRQSRVSRSGSSLMHHIAYLLTKRNFIHKTHFQREYVLEVGCKLDFFFPNLEKYKEEPKNCCAVACLTTANDRFRLTFAQMPEDTRNRACTAIGSSNFGEKLGPKSLTDTKLAEAKSQGVKFVILASALDNRLKSSKAVMTYDEWFSELESLRGFWN